MSRRKVAKLEPLDAQKNAPSGTPNRETRLDVGATRAALNRLLSESECVAHFAERLGQTARSARAQFKDGGGQFLGVGERLATTERDLRREIALAEAGVLKAIDAQRRLQATVHALRRQYLTSMGRPRYGSCAGYEPPSLAVVGDPEALGKALESDCFADLFRVAAEWVAPLDGRSPDAAAERAADPAAFAAHLRAYHPDLYAADAMQPGLVRQALGLVAQYIEERRAAPCHAPNETHDAGDK